MEIQKLFVSLLLDAADYVGGLDDAQNQAQSWSSRLRSSIGDGIKAAGAIATGALLGIATAAVGVAAASGAAFIGFQGQMNEVFTLLPGITQDAMDDMSGQVLQFSKDFAVLPDEVVPALYQSLSAGVPQDNVFSFLETAQKAAVGGVTELETAVDGISSVVNAYGSDVLSAAEASDKMFTAVRLGKTDFGQLSASLFNVIPTASSLGIEFGDVAAQLATLTAQGTPTSVATTQIRAAMVEASKSGTNLSNAIQDLTGKSFAELIQSGESMPAIFNDLRDSMPEQDFKDLFGSVEAMNAVLGVTGPNFDTVSAAMDEMAGAAGATDAAYEQMNTGIGRSIERMKAFGSATLIQIGDALSPLINMVLNFAEGALPKIEAVLNDTVIPAIETGIAYVGAFFDLLDQGLTPLDAIIELLWDLVPQSTLDALISLRDDILPGLVAWFEETVQPIIDLAAGFVSWQDILIVLAGVIAVTVLPILYSLLATIASIALPVVAAIAIVALMRQAWENDWGGIQGKVQTAVAFIQNIITSVMTAVQTFWSEHGEAIMTSAQTYWEFIQNMITTVLSVISSVFVAFKSAFEGDWRGFGENLRAAWDAYWEFIKTTFTNAGNAILRIAANLILNLISKFSDVNWGEVGGNIVRGIASGITSAAGAIADAARNAARAALDAAKGFLGIQSPSRLAAEQIGAPFTEGIAVGLADVAPIRRQMADLVNELTLPFSAVVPAGDGVNTAVPSPLPSSGSGGGGTIINIDARGTDAPTVDRLRGIVREELKASGRQADVRIRTT